MTDELLIEGLRNDRYLKTLRLIEQFEDKIKLTLYEFNKAMTQHQPELFDSATGSGSERTRHQARGSRFTGSTTRWLVQRLRATTARS
ncbi:MAG: hypothetical protein J07HX5_01552 [halophilic archaeon J07HX5]|jgi:hypothetical protein|nr:MAG: hypothetical protein J07HX5_01552 [halophilic archaeon J07HX5]